MHELVARAIPIRALTRDSSSANALGSRPGVELIEGDFRNVDSLERALDGVEKVFLAPPPDPQMEAMQRNLIAAAARTGVRHVVHLSAICADEREPSVSLGGHGRGERELESSGVAWTHLRANSFFQNTLADAPWIREESRFYSCVGDARFAKIDTRDVGAVAAVCLTESGHEGKTYVLNGPEVLSYAQLAEKLSKVLGRRIEYVDMAGPDYVEFLKRGGFPEWLAEEFYLIYGRGPLRHGGAARTDDAVQRLIGRPPRTFDDWAREYADAFAAT